MNYAVTERVGRRVFLAVSPPAGRRRRRRCSRYSPLGGGGDPSSLYLWELRVFQPVPRNPRTGRRSPENKSCTNNRKKYINKKIQEKLGESIPRGIGPGRRGSVQFGAAGNSGRLRNADGACSETMRLARKEEAPGPRRPTEETIPHANTTLTLEKRLI